MQGSHSFRRFRNSVHLSQEAVAEAGDVSQKAISQIETGKRKPSPELAEKLARVFSNAWELKASITFEQRSEFFPVPYLNGVDKHVQTTFDVLIEECRECIEAIERLKKLTRNKSSLSIQDRFEVMDNVEQIVDLYPALKMSLVSMAMVFGLDLTEANERLLQKLIEKKYYQDEGGEPALI